MPTITISGQVIDFPDTAQSPDWSPAVIQFAEAVANLLNSISGPFDIPSQAFNIDAYNPGSNVSIPGFAFPTANVRAAFIRYSVYRNTTGSGATTASEAGTMIIVYNPNGMVGNKWEVIRNYAGIAGISFTVLDTGQVQFTTTTMTGVSHTGQINFVAQSLLQSA